MKGLWSTCKKIIGPVVLVDVFLLLFMAVLLLYMGYTLLWGHPSSNEVDPIGVIVRTSSASIFGYLISSNFSMGNSSNPKESLNSQSSGLYVQPPAGHSNQQIRSAIGFSAGKDAADAQEGNSPSGVFHDSQRDCNQIQVCVVCTIGLVSLCILFFSNANPEMTPEWTAMISQLRDFVAACIGFLISCKKS